MVLKKYEIIYFIATIAAVVSSKKVTYENHKVFDFIDLSEDNFKFFNELVESDHDVSLC